MISAKLVIEDEVNVWFHGVDKKVRSECYNTLKHFIPQSIHSPKFKLGYWDGTVSNFSISGHTYLNLLPKVLPIIVDKYSYDLTIEDHRISYDFEFSSIDEDYAVNHMPNGIWPIGTQLAGSPIKIRDYQCDSINQFLQNTQAVGEIATGAGKSMLSAILSHKCEPYGRTLVIVPSKSLVTQTEKNFKLVGLDVGVFYGDRKDINHKHVISTWQSLHSLNKNKKKDPQTILDFKKDIVAVIVDEVHALKDDNVLKDLMCGFLSTIPIRWGLTGTVPSESKHPHLYESIVTFIGPIVNKISVKELQDKDILSKCHVNIHQIKDNKKYTTYQDEVNYLLTDEKRLNWIANLIQTRGKEGNTLILVNRIATGKDLIKKIPGSIFISGTMGNKERTTHYDSVNDNNNMMIIATYGVAAVGIDIPRIFNLILLEPGRSFARVIQSIGRGIRRAADKDFINIDDVCSTCKFSKRHMADRISMYTEAEYPHSLSKIDLPTE